MIATMFCEEDCGWGRERQAAGKSRDEALNELAGPLALSALLNPATEIEATTQAVNSPKCG